MSAQKHGFNNNAPKKVHGTGGITVVRPAEIGLSFRPKPVQALPLHCETREHRTPTLGGENTEAPRGSTGA
jgi:hypothetical protein